MFATAIIFASTQSWVTTTMSKKVLTTTSTRTTRILAIGTINLGVDQAKVLEILPNEVRETVNLYLDGKIDQWYSLQNRRGVVLILNVTDPTVAHEMLEKLPLGQGYHELRTDPAWPA